jgi:hypothetical protein
VKTEVPQLNDQITFAEAYSQYIQKYEAIFTPAEHVCTFTIQDIIIRNHQAEENQARQNRS